VNHFLLGIAEQTAPKGAAGGLIQLMPMVLIIGVMYLLVLRPQMKKQKELQRLLAELKLGDDVVTTGGLLGRISGMREEVLTLQVQEGVRVQVLRSAVSGRQRPNDSAKTESKGEGKSHN
jgi:preprotein translocase subunit YajC